MDHSRSSTPTLDDEWAEATVPVDLAALPSVFVLATHLDTDDLVAIENLLTRCNAPLTYDPSEARIFLGAVEQKRRAIFELRAVKVHTEEVAEKRSRSVVSSHDRANKKRRRDSPQPHDVIVLDDSSTESESETGIVPNIDRQLSSPLAARAASRNEASEALVTVPDNVVLVVKTAWLHDSITQRKMVGLSEYIIYKGRRVQEMPPPLPVPDTSKTIGKATIPAAASILARARAELGPDRGQTAAAFASTSQHRPRHAYSQRTSKPSSHIPSLQRQTTSEHDTAGSSNELPPMPDWVARRSTYSCERSTPADSPNAAFIAQLIIIRMARKLTADEIGVRAYSTSIASIAAYPYSITSSREILRLPGCEGKIASLWSEWRNKNGGGLASDSSSRSSPEPSAKGKSDAKSKIDRLAQGQVLIEAAKQAQDDPKLKVLRLFYDIWGVGDKTAREFYDNGWRDLDDVVEFGWSQLTRVQQIGVKYYDEFLLKIPRSEVEFIASKVHSAAQAVARDSAGVRSCIVGGYRRGKKESGDVDIIVSHLDESETIDCVQEIVRVLVDDGWITHELSTTLTGSRRGQATLPFRGLGGGHGFDTLDKALVVWQDPRWEGEKDLPEDMGVEQRRKKNPNVHRRVDIIIAPWSKVGCAVLGWSAGTTFERDLRRYAKYVRNWKFDSSGIRDRMTGNELDLEGVGGPCHTFEEAERKVFAGLGLTYREPWERCTN